MQEQKYILKDAKSFEPNHVFDCGNVLDGKSKKTEVIQEFLITMY